MGGFSSQSSLTSSSPATPISPNSPVSNRFYSSSGSLFSIGSDQLLDHSHLKPGNNAELLSYSKTINMYRENAKKTNDLDIQCDFAIFLVESAKQLLQKHEDEDERDRTQNAEEPNEDDTMRRSYLWEAEKILKQVAMRGHSESQYYLANMYASGLLTKSAKPDIDKAFPLFVQAAKHHHPDASYRTAKCYEEGLGTRKDKGKAVQFYRKAATLNHPGAMYRLGLAQLHGELGLSRNVRDGHKWLKRSAEAATPQYPHALHELAGLHEKGNAIVFVDHAYCVTLYNEAAALRYAPSAFRLGECYEFGKLGCDPDPALSIQYYAIAAEQGHPDACFALTAWYLVGAPNVLEPSDEQAYAWACRAALSGHARAEYAVGYFCEVGIGVAKNPDQAMTWYQKAAEHGDRRAPHWTPFHCDHPRALLNRNAHPNDSVNFPCHHPNHSGERWPSNNNPTVTRHSPRKNCRPTKLIIP
ncbi:uncharacterized protein BYT42DRAFT_599682 [Radiomyces spectabilis]|uniref:uncharacterized protein n=1 Tax=Radiomyces spectabilis TaxID=64574 RepID=UPI002220FE96|nr:uncharacterized protein BYT42DRAFT_599682 [Radiomyces spectabilis]KAI8372997.1 hypothetical protein BYT42DRAFT_599682 [Radiomyces spectabilis]